MLRCITGLEEIDSGDIIFDGTSIPKAGKDITRIRSDIGIESEVAVVMASRYVEQEIVNQVHESVAAVLGEPV